MIAIVNITKNPKPKGRHTYSLRINDKEITQFTHNREDSLSVCLQKASEAARVERNKPIWEVFLSAKKTFFRCKTR